MTKLSCNCLIIMVLSMILGFSGSGWGKSFDKEKDAKGQATEKEGQKYSSPQPKENREGPCQELQEQSSIPGDANKDESTKNKGTKQTLKKTKKTTRLKSLSKSKKDLFGQNETVKEELPNSPSGQESNSNSELQITINSLFEDPLSQKIVEFGEEDDDD